MASRLDSAARAALLPPHNSKHLSIQALQLHYATVGTSRRLRVRASDGASESYLHMWKKAVDRQRKEIRFHKIVENRASFDDGVTGGDGEAVSPEDLERKSNEFQKILEVPKEERDKVQRMQVIDRAAAAIAAARAIIKESPPPPVKADSGVGNLRTEGVESRDGGTESWNSFSSHSRTPGNVTPGPDFWSWTPPPVDDSSLVDSSNLQKSSTSSVNPNPINSVMEKDRSLDFLSIPFASKLSSNLSANLPPFQSLMEDEKPAILDTRLEISASKDDLGVNFSAQAAEAACALEKVEEQSTYGINPDGSRWWKETGVERRSDGVICRWTLTRGVSADEVVEWEDKYWEAADRFGYKELGSEKSGRDATGNVWHEYWKESMWQERGLLRFEKTTDKWGKNRRGEEWQEKWSEQYDASGRADKWAHKWCSIDLSTQLEAGHAHVWHERWGEKYDGLGGSVKYTDKWAERHEGGGWTRWGDKWDEHFDLNGHGVKQGETWWEGLNGERWNRTWGEQHNGTGWVHKYGGSSSGEHWDTHVQEDTWYERHPHYGFMHCFENSVQLREVKEPSDMT
ncbi:hypothetical protein Ancab_013270 [Ancistrocladus abbreviatus]